MKYIGLGNKKGIEILLAGFKVLVASYINQKCLALTLGSCMVAYPRCRQSKQL